MRSELDESSELRGFQLFICGQNHRCSLGSYDGLHVHRPVPSHAEPLCKALLATAKTVHSFKRYNVANILWSNTLEMKTVQTSKPGTRDIFNQWHERRWRSVSLHILRDRKGLMQLRAATLKLMLWFRAHQDGRRWGRGSKCTVVQEFCILIKHKKRFSARCAPHARVHAHTCTY